MHMPCDPADLLGILSDATPRTPGLCSLLTACGVDTALISGGASKYEKFLALAASMPLCMGHPIADQLESTLHDAIGTQAPLCPHTARDYWEAWINIHWYGRELDLADYPALLLRTCPHCALPTPTRLSAADMVPLPDVVELARVSEKHDHLSAFDRLTVWSECICRSLPSDGVRPLLVVLPSDYVYRRPDPYHVRLVLEAATGEDELPVLDCQLLLTQALRLVGEHLCACGGVMVLQGGSAWQVRDLLLYLSASDRLPDTVWCTDASVKEISSLAYVSGLFPCLQTGIVQTLADSSESLCKKMAAYSAIAPIGRAVILYTI